MSDILLTTLNARYAHASFGLRYLLANLGPLRPSAALLEFDISQRPLDIVEAILAHAPKIIGLGVYIWNADETRRLVAELKRVAPEVIIILGGPEVSYETDQQPIVTQADYVITGEADLAFADLCEKLLTGKPPLQKIIPADLPQFLNPEPRTLNPPALSLSTQDSALRTTQLSTQDSALRTIHLPYPLYTDHDLAHRVVYVEASRGCPFKCEFCLSSLDVPVRNVPLEAFLAAMQTLLDRGLRRFKFVDRTFNLNLTTSRAILQFFLDRYTPGLFLHFEMIPDRLPEPLRDLISQFPPGALQFEVGIQTFNDEVAARISRRQDNVKLADNLTFLRTHTGVHVHADLIVGLPGEDIHSFAAGFDRLVALGPHEIQVGILKRLRGTPIVRHDQQWQMVYSPNPPYEVLRTGAIDFPMMQRLRRFARFWDLLANSGNFSQTIPLLWRSSATSADSPFKAFLAFSDWLSHRLGRTHAIALDRLAEALFQYLIQNRNDPAPTAHLLWDDFIQAGRKEGPQFLRAHISPLPPRTIRAQPQLPRAKPATLIHQMKQGRSRHPGIAPEEGS